LLVDNCSGQGKEGKGKKREEREKKKVVGRGSPKVPINKVSNRPKRKKKREKKKGKRLIPSRVNPGK